MKLVMETKGLVTGIIYQDKNAPSYQEQVTWVCANTTCRSKFKMSERNSMN